LVKPLSKDEVGNTAQKLQGYQKELEQLKQAQKNINPKKLRPENQITWQGLATFINERMRLDDIAQTQTDLKQLLKKDANDWVIYKEANPSFFSRHKKKLLAAVAVLPILGLATHYALQVKNTEQLPPEPIPVVEMTLYSKDGLFGYKLDDSIAISAQFTTAESFENGQAKVSRNDSVFYIDETGGMVELIFALKPNHYYCDYPWNKTTYLGEIYRLQSHDSCQFIVIGLKYNIGGVAFTFEGEIRNDMPYFGLAKYENGNTYEGYFNEKGNRHIHGKFTYSDGGYYEGNIENNTAEGEGMLKFADGSYYKGHFENNKMNGSGALYAKNGRLDFSGTFKNDKFIK
jgi:hypothetical protein